MLSTFPSLKTGTFEKVTGNRLMERVSPVAPSGKSKLLAIIAEAQHLRHESPDTYGLKGARAGQKGYVKNGWQLAVADATAALGGSKSASRKKPKPELTKLQKAAKSLYLEKLRCLQAEYFPLMGRKLSNKVAVIVEESSSVASKGRSASLELAPVHEKDKRKEEEDDEEQEPRPAKKSAAQPPVEDQGEAEGEEEQESVEPMPGKTVRRSKRRK